MILIQHTMYSVQVCKWFKISHTILVQESEAGPSGSVEHSNEGEGPEGEGPEEEDEEEGNVSTTMRVKEIFPSFKCTYYV